MSNANSPIYNPAEIEGKWQKKWDDDGLYDSNIDPSKPKHYALTMLPYPSGDLHIGHWFAMTPPDARARFKRMQGYNVLFPMGFDAFGLPAENAAIKNNIHPKQWTYRNIEKMRKQFRSLGAMFDWRREAVSADPDYYRWTQWFFTQLFKHGLAYRKAAWVDWCPHDNTTLAREQVWGEDRHCERCGTPVIKKNLEQWFFKTTQYADELLKYDAIDWPERVRTLQTNWIGRSEGAAVYFTTEQGDVLEVFTTRPDTLWGATFMVLAPEHPLVAKLTSTEQKAQVENYSAETQRMTDIQREATDKEKTGVFTGGYAINPVNGRRIPVWIADYVLLTYGTGAIMAVPAHDERDFAFAIKFGLPIQPVIDRPDGVSKSYAPSGTMSDEFATALQAAGIPFIESNGAIKVTIPAGKTDTYVKIAQDHLQPGSWNEIVGARWQFIFDNGIWNWESVDSGARILARCKEINLGVNSARTLMEMLWGCEFYRDILTHADYGTMIHSGEFSGTPGSKAKKMVTRWLEENGKGKYSVNYRLRDWLISRQRYWGAPIPIIYCPTHGAVPVPDDKLPVLLPDDVEWMPTGQSPLKLHPTWKVTTCPVCGGPAERETDTMDTFMCSSWYHLRYLSPQYQQGPFDPKEYDYWMPVDTYTGGIEHANMHLIYTRFFHKACRDMGITKGDEPMLQLRNQGMVLGEDSEKMSKSRGNVLSPDDLVQTYGADAVRAYLIFFSRWDQGGPWSSGGIEGVNRWIRRVWAMIVEPGPEGSKDEAAVRALRRKVHQTLKAVTRDFEQFEFNTIVSGLMELANEMLKAKQQGLYHSAAWKEAVELYLLMLAPVSPHIAEELWMQIGKPYSIHTQNWPKVDEEAAREDEITLVVQINGKVRDRIQLPAGISEADARARTLASPVVQKNLEGKTPRQIIYVAGKLINIVV
ncbi:MAG: leucine--tRNA ligase [Chloroflexi bacterium GWB2_54_36]|nr:MAG: leucine--tRNA ligase [Chloroflexi bacterium GWB2_54_36]